MNCTVCTTELETTTGGFHCPTCNMSWTATMRIVSGGPGLQSLPKDDMLETIDLDAEHWKTIKEAVRLSPWIPQEYFMNDVVADIVRFLKTNHDHTCQCGTSQSDHGHHTGQLGCVRSMVDAPTRMSNDQWLVGGFLISDYTLKFQRGYHQHECGCWSSHGGSDNSVQA